MRHWSDAPELAGTHGRGAVTRSVLNSAEGREQEHSRNVLHLTDELPDELGQNSHGTHLAVRRKCRRHVGLRLVEPSGIEPLTSSLRTRRSPN